MSIFSLSPGGVTPTLAFNDPWHDSAFFFCDDAAILHIESERISRRKYEYVNPMLIFCEHFAERITSFPDIALAINGELHDFFVKLLKAKWQGSELPDVPFADPLLVTEFDTASGRNKTAAVQSFLRHLMHRDTRLYLCGHHASHAANAFYSSPFEKALVLTLDGGGMDYVTAPGTANAFNERDLLEGIPGTGRRHIYGSVYACQSNRCHLLQQFDEFSIGKMWGRITTRIFGLLDGEEGTVMAMAALGDPDRFGSLLESPILSYPEEYTLSDARKAEIDAALGTLRGLCHTEQDLFDVAAALQASTERRVRALIATCLQPEFTDLCLSGGVFLNCQLTGKIRDWFPQIEHIYIPPAPYDGGLCIGAAQLVRHEVFDRPREPMPTGVAPFALGRRYSRQEVLDAVATTGVAVASAPADLALKLVAAGKILALFQGGAESGRRALGNRSIIAHPGIPGLKDRLNQIIKHRQWYRPFAPMILADHLAAWFDCPPDFSSPYMSFAVPVRSEVRDKIRNVVHFDGTARLQTVHRELSPELYALLSQWYELTGLPLLLNTSFNDREPIVETPRDAIDTFNRTQIDNLYFADHQLLVSWQAAG